MKIYQVVDVLWKIRSQSLGLEDTEDLVAGDETDPSNPSGYAADLNCEFSIEKKKCPIEYLYFFDF